MNLKIGIIGYIWINSLITVFSRSIEDPVAKHDSKQCAVYLCKEHPDMATEYLNSGCEGDFGDFIRKSHIQMIETQMDIVKESSCSIDDKPIDPISLMMIVSLSSCISLLIGILYAKYENEYMNTMNDDEEEEEQELVEKDR